MSDNTDCPEFLKPRLRMFMSADIIGSTAQKQSHLGALGDSLSFGGVSWFTTIQGFYFEAQQSMRAEWEGLQAIFSPSSPECFGEAPILWKTVGDEVLFTKLVTDHRQVAVTLQCWIRALNAMREFLVRDNSRLGVKSTVWLAGFPFRNKEVVLSGESFSKKEPIENYYRENGIILNKLYAGNAKDVIVDYIGPSIDTGFRLTGHATARKLILSIEVAYILAHTSPVKGGPIQEIRLRYDGQIQLKGVLGGAGYPVFWINLSKDESADILEDNLSGKAEISRDAVYKFCDAFFSENSSLIFPPFIMSSTESSFRQKPDWYDEHHKNLVKNFNDSLAPPPEPEEVEGTTIETTNFDLKLGDFERRISQLKTPFVSASDKGE